MRAKVRNSKISPRASKSVFWVAPAAVAWDSAIRSIPNGNGWTSCLCRNGVRYETWASIMRGYELNAADWIKRFPLESIPDEYRRGGSVASPIIVSAVEQLRHCAAAQQDLGGTVPPDI